ncbi:hypothetical protein [Haloarcula onubensis]|uniref:DUF1761 domain-containing protein n=1 Tax=Haloarcula onubensis TaxID=2950539 RepID=A0ABU2FK00_9EURY|nr:hypothetical protein [Halomicroarcula sp. S3CR25-11]MDS0280521.1 hypothetical protein [Halomicroarcula sp. S3CR25-11]
MVSWLTSTVLMGVAVLAVGWLAWHRGWYQYSPTAAVTPVRDPGRLSEDPRALGVAFAVLVLAAVGGVAAYLTGPGPMVGAAVAAGAGGLLVAYLLGGVYLSATSRGHPRSLAVAESVTVAGALFLVAVTLQLLGSG